MIRWLLRKAMDRFERTWHDDSRHLRDIIDASPRAAWLFSRISSLGQFRRDLSLAEHVEAMPAHVALLWRFTRATLARDPIADPYRQVILKHRGARALVSLALAITTTRMYPTVEYAHGHGQACMRVVVDGTPVMVRTA